jgi:hypothetical protein
MDNPSMAVDLPTEPTTSSSTSMHPRLHRQKLQSKTNRGKTFRSLKNNKAVANIEVHFRLISIVLVLHFQSFFKPVLIFKLIAGVAGVAH